MCGICGYWAFDGAHPSEQTFRQMTASIAHRGPDADGHWREDTCAVGLGHRRLSIIELSELGAQPMHASGGRWVITFNGEIYNFRALRAELETHGHRFRGHSDTEVMLAAVEQWGVASATSRFVGIFAFALWDRRERCLYLVRDHLGVKPLYYGRAGRTLVFGSELKPLALFPGFDRTIDRGAMTLLLRHNCIPAPYSIYRNAKKLPAGSILRVDERGIEHEPEAYWSASDVAERGSRSPLTMSDTEATDALESRLRESIGLQMMADVPLGAFLSGGVDSSTVVALMQAQSAQRVKTFSIGFPDARYDEAGAARAVALHLGTDHTELYVTPEDALQLVPSLPRFFDEPFSDSSQLPTMLVSALARQHVTVSLSGDGGDELFAGYNRHVLAERLWRRMRFFPRGIRTAAAGAIRSIAPETLERSIDLSGLWRSRQVGSAGIGAKLHKLASILDVREPAEMYSRLVSHWAKPTAVVLHATELATLVSDRTAWPALPSLTELMMYLDLVTYLPDDILVKVDRASMAYALEARVPLLDHRLVEFAWQLPLHQKLRGGVSKWLLREVLYRHVPRALIDRPKKGFAIPLDAWLRGPLRDWAESLLDESRLRREGYFDPKPIREKWATHLSGSADCQYELWDILMFQSWLAHSGGT
jgi:asparagine synthase (glutamine-hydrolysing)